VGKTQKKAQAKKSPSRKRAGKGAGASHQPLKRITPNHRRFAELLVLKKYDPVPAYMEAFGCTRAVALKAYKALLLDPTFMAYRDSTLVPMLKDIEADKQFIAQETYAIAMANVMDYFDVDENRNLVLKDLSTVPAQQQRNIKKIKVTQRVVAHKGGKDANKQDNILEQKIELEMHDRAAHLHKLGLIWGAYTVREDAGDLVERTFAAEARRVAHAREERERRVNSGEMKEVDGFLIEQNPNE
jgi:hypothetical protein